MQNKYETSWFKIVNSVGCHGFTVFGKAVLIGHDIQP